MEKMVTCYRGRPRFPLQAAALLVFAAATATADVKLYPVQDNYVNRCTGSGSETNYGAAERLMVRSYDGDGCSVPEPKSARALLQFDLAELTGAVSRVDLRMYYYAKIGTQDPAGRTYQVRRLLNDWTEGEGVDPGGTTLGSSFQNRHNDGSATVQWDSHDYDHIDDYQGCSEWDYLGGGDFPYTDCGGTDHWGGDEVWATAEVPSEYGWIEWDVTELVQGWLDGSYENHGLVVMDAWEQWHAPFPDAENAGKWACWVRSREYSDETYQPHLAVLYVGDIDQDGDVDLSDLASLLSCYGTSTGDAGYDPLADLDGDGTIGLADLAALLGNYGIGS